MTEEINPIIPLSYNIADKKRKYILLCGSGISKDAGIPTGWDILLEALRLIRHQMDGEVIEYTNEEMESYYNEKFEGATYSEIIEKMFPGDEEQREFLEEMFKDKHPGKAHDLIAKLIDRGLVRLIITTNFDSKIEEALDNLDMRGKYSVISNNELVLTSKPWNLVDVCRIYKPHGTIEQGKLRNTQKDLMHLEEDVSTAILDIFEKHGIIVLGYAGEDKGIMDILNARRFLGYTLYWTTRSGKHNPEVEKLLEKQDGKTIKIDSASEFLEEILNRVEIAQTGIEQTSEIVAQTRFKNAIAGSTSDTAVKMMINEERTKLVQFIKTILSEVDERDYKSLWEGFIKIFNYSFQFLLLADQVITYQDKYWNEIFPIFEEIHSLNKNQSRDGKEGLVNYSFYSMLLSVGSIAIQRERFEFLRSLLSIKRINRRGDGMENILSWNSYARFINIKNDDQQENKWIAPRIHYLRDLIETQKVPFQFSFKEQIYSTEALFYLYSLTHQDDSYFPFWIPESFVYDETPVILTRIKLDPEFGGKVATELFKIDYPCLIEEMKNADVKFQKEISSGYSGYRVHNPFYIFR